MSELILASREVGTSLFPISVWPTYVYICYLERHDVPVSDYIESSKLSLVGWGEIYKTMDEAARVLKASEIPENHSPRSFGQ